MQITVGGHRVGIIGLSEAIDETKSLHRVDVSEIAQTLLDKIKAQNYVPDSRKEDYARALFREYQKALGLPVDDSEDKSEGLFIKILGPGCYACEQLEKDVKTVLAELNLAADVEHVRDLNQIAEYGLMGTPSLVINAEVVLNGRSLPKSQLKSLLETKLKKKNNS